MFKEYRDVKEIRRSEYVSDNCKPEESWAFKDIKPETNMSFEEASSFWNDIFQSMRGGEG